MPGFPLPVHALRHRLSTNVRRMRRARMLRRGARLPLWRNRPLADRRHATTRRPLSHDLSSAPRSEAPRLLEHQIHENRADRHYPGINQDTYGEVHGRFLGGHSQAIGAFRGGVACRRRLEERRRPVPYSSAERRDALREHSRTILTVSGHEQAACHPDVAAAPESRDPRASRLQVRCRIAAAIREHVGKSSRAPGKCSPSDRETT
jgi:hypothetical protein